MFKDYSTNEHCMGQIGEDGEVMAEDINPKFQLLCEEVLQNLCSSYRKTCVSILMHLA